MGSWQVQDAKARFSQFLDAALKEGPQIVIHRGMEAAVLVPIEQWKRLNNATRPSLKEWLLAPAPRFENVILARRKVRCTNPVEFK